MENKEKKDKKSKKKIEHIDPGISYTNMNVPGMRHYEKNKHNGTGKIKLSKEERRNILRSGLKAMLPKIAALVLGFLLAFGLVALWLGVSC